LKILITGGSGFIGTNFITKAIDQGHTIYNIDNLSLFKKDHNKKNKNYVFNKIDIKNKEPLTEILNKFQPNKIIHMAAESHVDNSIQNPQDFISTNIMGTYNILQASLEFWNSKNVTDNFCFHHVSTDEVFGSLKKNQKPFTEDSKYRPNSPYSASKAASDHLVRAWNNTYNLPCTITYCTNNYGPFQYPEKLIPVTIMNGILKKNIPVYGTGNNVRDWIYVEDHVCALIEIIENNIINKSFAIGSDNEKNNIEVVTVICDILDKILDSKVKHKTFIKFVKDRLGHDYRYAINSNLIKKEIGWKAKIDFTNGILRTVNWYLENQNWWKKLINKV